MATTDRDRRRIRAAKNQSLFRDVNERIEEVGEGLGLGASELEFICECAHEGCTEHIQMTHSEYEAVRRVPTHFAVVAGHEIDGVEEIVERNARYVVVVKLGAGGEMAMKLDARSGPVDPT
jgi:hypothetical protein